MFVLQDRYRFDYPVDVNMGIDGDGKPVVQRFTVTFEPLLDEEVEAMEAEIATLPPTEQADKRDDLLRRTIVGWGDVVTDPDKKTPAPFGAEALDAMLKRPWIKIALFNAYTAAVTNRAAEERRRGN